MAYSDKARAARLCTQTRTNGKPCRAFAAWGDPEGRCSGHGGRNQFVPRPCTCCAYKWPHRPGGGLCRWPDPPAGTCATAPGTHARDRKATPPRMIREAIRGMKLALGRPAMLNGGRRPRKVRTVEVETVLADGWPK